MTRTAISPRLAIRIFDSTADTVRVVAPSDPNQPSTSTGGSGPWARTWPPGWTVEYVPVTGSTNTDLLETAFERPDRSVRATGHQTAGRGRMDRRWDTPPDTNLMVSILSHRVPEHAIDLTRRMALAACAAVAEVAGVSAALKWPNDILVGDAKLAGILAQRHARGPVVAGMGLNIGWAPDGAARLGDDVVPADVLEALLVAYDRLPADLTEVYRDHLTTLGKAVRVHLPAGEVFEGRAVAVEPDGRLVVVDDCALTRRFDAADVIHLR
ncbi:MAG: biotin--[acetyl-CoA-carboxylase] ligase [Desertimonas sp.]